jgi:hypothetical protein
MVPADRPGIPGSCRSGSRFSGPEPPARVKTGASTAGPRRYKLGPAPRIYCRLGQLHHFAKLRLAPRGARSSITIGKESRPDATTTPSASFPSPAARPPPSRSSSRVQHNYSRKTRAEERLLFLPPFRLLLKPLFCQRLDPWIHSLNYRRYFWPH